MHPNLNLFYECFFSLEPQEHVKRRKIIKVNTFTKSVTDCRNYFILDLNHKFVDLRRVTDDILSIIYDQLPRETTHDARVPPLALMRFARGGKTTTIANVFDALKAAGGVNPILISFNGSGIPAFKHQNGETQTEAILRLIGVQLGDYTDQQALDLVIDRDALNDKLNGNVVLLIDELNILGMPLENDAAQLLREMFLDKRGRFLVFTSHFPVSIEGDAAQAIDLLGKSADVRPSLRGISTVNMSLGNTLTELRAMSTACEALTEETAAWLAYIPSLIYCSMNDTGIHGVVTPSMRFRQMNITVEPGKKLDTLKRFVEELLSGQRDPEVARYYGAFASVGADTSVSYPLCYAKEIFMQLNLNEATKEILAILWKLESHLDSKHSGLAWECTVEVAIILRMLEAQWSGSQGPFGLATEGTKPELAFRTLPDECVVLEEARGLIDSMIAEYKSPTLIYVGSASATFPHVEGFVVFASGPATAKIVGFQTKAGDVKPRKCINLDAITGGAVLIRGHALAKNPREPKSGWKYMTSKEVRQFLGHSLLLAMPRDWLRDS